MVLSSQNSPHVEEEARSGNQEEPLPRSPEESHIAAHDTETEDDEGSLIESRPTSPETDDERPLTRTEVAIVVSKIVHIENADREEAYCRSGEKDRQRGTASEESIAACDTEQTKEKKNAKVAETHIAIGVLANRIGYGGGNAEKSEAEHEQDTFEAESIGDREEQQDSGNKGGDTAEPHGALHVGCRQSASSEHPLGATAACQVGTTLVVSIVVAEIRQELEEERRQERQDESQDTKTANLRSHRTTDNDKGERQRKGLGATSLEPSSNRHHSETKIRKKAVLNLKKRKGQPMIQ
jgi:hypothetical protein